MTVSEESRFSNSYIAAVNAIVAGDRDALCAAYENDAAALNRINIEDNQTILSKAVETGRSDLVQALLDIGADPEIFAPDYVSPLMLAASKGFAPVVIELLEHGAALETANGSGATALICAVANAQPETVKTLLQRGAQPDAQTTKGNTALMWAAQKAEGTDEARMLLAHNADIYIRNEEGQTAADYAREAGRADILDLFENKEREMQIRRQEKQIRAREKSTLRRIRKSTAGLPRL